MVNYLVTRWSIKGEYDEVLLAMETQIETVTDTKTIHLMNIVPRGNEFVGLLIYDT